jgi:hypothetical protein
MVFLTIQFDIINDLLTPDKNSALAFLIGLVGGVVGSLIRSSIRNSKDTLPFFRRGDVAQYTIWPLFGALLAVTINVHPFFSLMFGVFSPLLYVLLENKMPQFLINLIPKGNDNANKEKK